MKNEEINKADLVASFQNAVVDALVSRAMMLVKERNIDKLAIAGGVALIRIKRGTFKCL